MGVLEKNGAIMLPPHSSPVFTEDNVSVRAQAIQCESSVRWKYDEVRLYPVLKQNELEQSLRQQEEKWSKGQSVRDQQLSTLSVSRPKRCTRTHHKH